MLARAGTGWFVELATVRELGSVPGRIASVVGLPVAASKDPLAAIVDHLASVRGLMVLDNLEQLDEPGGLVSSLLRGTHHLQVLATSRAPLRIAAEQQFPVPLLTVPAARQSEAGGISEVASVRLLVDRARASDPAFVVTDGNAADLAEIARRLDGLPLALEIAAPWLRLLTPAGLLARLTSSLDLPARRTDLAPRHRTLRDTIGWSMALLPDRQRLLLACLSVFVGSFTLPGAEGVCVRFSTSQGDIAADLLDLVERNLVQRQGTVDLEPRFRLLAAVRDFAAEQVEVLDEVQREDLRHAHAEWYAQFAGQLAARSEGPDSGSWLSAAVVEADNLRAAIEALAQAGRHDERLQLVVDAMTVWFEAADRAEGRIVRYGPTGPDAVRCGASYNLASVWLYRSVATALAWQQEALARAEREGDRRIIAVNAARLALVHLLAGDRMSAREELARSPGLVSRTVTARWEDIVTYAQGQLAHHEGDLDEAEAHLLRVHRSASSAGRPLHTVLSAAALADLRLAQGRVEDATTVLAHAERLITRDAEPGRIAALTVRQARIDRITGTSAAGRRRLESVAGVLTPKSLPPERIIWLLESGAHAVEAGSFSECHVLLDLLTTATSRTGVVLPPWERIHLDVLLASVDRPQ